ncbi:uncharacterized protein MYCFIDRAFT_172330 [Pseudocercospora fijiensis CIRAD86]|uniref:Uncharacterized protein n=1 Tax=Pseudocercospora fijiensis (strain CIRAD86) TaxID=383855 RepID=M3BBD9_PSEFD|nr:uncharacterized protein MYCFIDRAFT_172330 [Pseudocercospora fijiensis CIRAD86]EME86612.1 hypothetical protein MYCFIDRAFT_172330 [Pseudocercospora fijiensis CIRAD86]
MVMASDAAIEQRSPFPRIGDDTALGIRNAASWSVDEGGNSVAARFDRGFINICGYECKDNNRKSNTRFFTKDGWLGLMTSTMAILADLKRCNQRQTNTIPLLLIPGRGPWQGILSIRFDSSKALAVTLLRLTAAQITLANELLPDGAEGRTHVQPWNY